jgi:uncharacterized protein YaeQ
MALTATVYQLGVELSDTDRGVYETLALRAACHPSESADFLATRLLAYCLEYEDGIGFSGGGVSEGDEPAIAVRDPGGRIRAWIEVGWPDAARLHKAAKAADRVAVYTVKEARGLLRQLEGERIHRAEEIPIYSFDRELIDGLTSRLDRRTQLQMTVSGREIYLTANAASWSGAVREQRLG